MLSDVVKSLKILVGQGAVVECVDNDHIKLTLNFTSLSDNEKRFIARLEHSVSGCLLPTPRTGKKRSFHEVGPENNYDYELDCKDEDAYEFKSELQNESLDGSMLDSEKAGPVSPKILSISNYSPTGAHSGGYYRRTNLEITNLHPNREGGIISDTVPADAVLVSLYQQLSNKVLSALYPSVWTKNGKFNSRYKHLRGISKANKDRTIPNKDGLQWCILFDKVFQCQLISNPVG
ncbi:hypothetical protein FDECE_15000 [Fusarium decemcellulare]|nr:hypothetical protein FDECE_15000 [Fusarium decemcellulare]